MIKLYNRTYKILAYKWKDSPEKYYGNRTSLRGHLLTVEIK